MAGSWSARARSLQTVALLLCVSSQAVGCLRFAYEAGAERGGRSGAGDRAGGETSEAGRPGSTDGLNGGEGGGAGAPGVRDVGVGDAGVAGARGGAGGVAAQSGSGAGTELLDAGSAGSASDSGVSASDAALPDSGASAPDAAMPGVDAAVPEVTPPCSGALFCDGFESVGFDTWSYSLLLGNGALARSTDVRHTGVGALVARTGLPFDQARYAAVVLGRQKSGEAWLRYYYYIPSTTQITAYISAGVMSEISQPYAGFSLLVYPTTIGIESMMGTYHAMTPFPRDRWVCVEHHVVIDNTAGSFEVYLDGVLAVSSPLGATRPNSGYSSAEVGIHYAGDMQGPAEVFVDDVAVGTARAPCH